MDKKGWIFFAVIVIGLFGILIYRSQGDKAAVDDINPFQIQKPSPANGEIGDHVKNPNSKSLTLIEYGDFQCPGCQAIHPIVENITDEFADDVQFVFRGFPLSYHANARASLAAANAASLQDHYWEMFDKIYSNGEEWESAGPTERTDIFVRYAKEFDLDIPKFKKDMDSDAVKKKISFDIALARKSNVESTPNFFLDGKKLDPEKINSIEGFRTVIEEALKNRK